MKKIIIGYEKYDPTTTEGWNYNGRINHSKLSKPYEPINPWLDNIYKCLIDPFSTPDSYKMHSCLFESITPYSEHVNMQVDKIPENKTYFYPILLVNIGLYIRYTNTIDISEKVRQDVLNKKAFIIFVYDNEGDLRNVYEKFSELIINLNLPKDRVIVLHGDLDVKFFSNAPFTYYPMRTYFMHWLSQYKDCYINQNYILEKLYLTHNRTIRPHKQLMLYSLVENDLVDDGVISCGNLYSFEIFKQYGYTFTDDNLVKLTKLQMSSTDNQIENGEIRNMPRHIDLQSFENTFVSLVTETLENSIFMSEKTFKPILVMHPFIILSGKGHLSELQNLGFKTFNNFWNEDYDQESDLILRIRKITKILLYLKNLSKQDLYKMRTAMNDILLYNRQLLLSYINKSSTTYHGRCEIKQLFQNLNDQ